MISVIVPSYNVAPYLQRCVDSLIGQTYSDLEIKRYYGQVNTR